MNQIWLIPVIAIGVWLLAALIRNANQKGKAMPPEPQPQGRPRRRPTSNEIDRFLEEVRRRQQAQRRPADEDVPEVQPVVIEPTPRPPPPPVRRTPPASVTRAKPSPVTVRTVAAVDNIPVALAVDARPSTTIAPIPAPEPPQARLPGHLVELQRLLHSPQGIRAAFLLNEILGPPKCRRRR
jgi:hypothetical protein